MPSWKSKKCSIRLTLRYPIQNSSIRHWVWKCEIEILVRILLTITEKFKLWCWFSISFWHWVAIPLYGVEYILVKWFETKTTIFGYLDRSLLLSAHQSQLNHLTLQSLTIPRQCNHVLRTLVLPKISLKSWSYKQRCRCDYFLFLWRVGGSWLFLKLKTTVRGLDDHFNIKNYWYTTGKD